MNSIKDILLTPYIKTQEQLKDVIFMFSEEDLPPEDEEEVSQEPD